MSFRLTNQAPVLSVALAAAALVTALPAQATVTFNLNDVFSSTDGAVPTGTIPWLTATFADAGLNTVTLTMTANSGWDSDQFVSEWYFNYTGDVDGLTITYASGQTGTASTGTDAFQADGDGKYDILFDFPAGPPSARFVGGDTSVWTITGLGVSEDDFDTLSFDAGGAGPFLTAAHIQGIPKTGGGTCSAWVTQGTAETGAGGCPLIPPPPPITVREPTTLAALGSGMMLMGLGTTFARRRRLDE